MNATNIIIQLFEQLGISRAEGRRMLQQLLTAISQQLSEGKNVMIRGFDTLGLRGIRARKKNPNLEQTVFFRASQTLKTIVRPCWGPFPYYALPGVNKFDPRVIEEHIYEIDDQHRHSLQLASN